LENIQKFYNPVGELKRPKFDAKIAKKGDFEYLLFLGCAIFDPRIEAIARKAIELLKLAGVDFAILNEERCCGNDVKAIGEIGLFELLREYNMSTFENLGVEKIIAISPHCYNAFKNYYRMEVYHVLEILLEKIEKGELKFKRIFEGRVTYHDPCYIGRYNKIISEPRDLL
ncbi:MAG: (Fe-S)-binding protein, partial [Archaeoglobaceae archaeon]